MWWLELHGKIRQLPRLATIMAVAGLVAGCFQPLYGAKTADGSTVADQLRRINVDQIKTVAGTPEAGLAAELHNVLIFELGGGGSGSAPPTHKLTVNMQSNRQQVIVDITTSRPDVEQAALTAQYSLVEIASGKTVVTGQTFARVSYDIPGQEQRFARARGRRDAEHRAAKVIAENIRTRLASYFIAGT
jgi:LPS-assembly lipoprotein